MPAPPSCCSSSAASPSSSSRCPASPRTPGRPAWTQNPSTDGPCTHEKHPQSVLKIFVFFKMSGSHYTMCSPPSESLLNQGVFDCNCCFFPLFFFPFFFLSFLILLFLFLFLRKQKDHLTPSCMCENGTALCQFGAALCWCSWGEMCVWDSLGHRGDSLVMEKMFGVVGHRSMRDIRLLYLTWSERDTVGSQCPHLCHTPLLPSEGLACSPGDAGDPYAFY